jgi:hypothetical protein
MGSENLLPHSVHAFLWLSALLPASARGVLAPQFRITPSGSTAHRLAACAASALAGDFFVGSELRHGAIAGDTSVVPDSFWSILVPFHGDLTTNSRSHG